MAEEFQEISVTIPVKKTLNEALNTFLQELLTNTPIQGILVPMKLQVGVGFSPTLVTSPELLKDAEPIAPIMPVNAAKAVSDFTRLTPSQEPVAVVLRPCEARALVELVKLKQANLENVILITLDCPGTFPIQLLADTTRTKDLKSDVLITTFKNLKGHTELRRACHVCEHFSPIDMTSSVDVRLGMYGLDTGKQFLVEIASERANEILQNMNINFETGPNKYIQAHTKAVNELKEKRRAVIQKSVEETQKRISGLDNFLHELSACINCHNCMSVCPICYCKECFFESPTFDLEASKYMQMADFKGALRIPSNMFLFHVTRLNHMVLSCTACGMCEQGCPANIPLLEIYKTVGLNAQNMFEYEPGRDLEEEIPILTFKEDELEPR